jgi:hypothetical protein
MNADQADRVLAALCAAWPEIEITAPTAMTWYDHLADIPEPAGMEAVRRIVASDRYFPRVSRFREVALAARRDLESQHARERGLPEPPLTEADSQRNLAALRALRSQLTGGA